MNLEICEQCLKKKIFGYSLLKTGQLFKVNGEKLFGKYLIKLYVSAESCSPLGNCYLNADYDRDNLKPYLDDFKRESHFVKMTDKRCPYLFEHQLSDWNNNES